MKCFQIIILLVFSSWAYAMDYIQPLPEKLKEIVEQKVTEDQYFPILKPGDWIGIKYGAVHTRLLGSEEQPELVLGFGYDTPDNFIFLTEKNHQKIDVQTAIKKAYSNIDTMAIEFTPVKSLDNKVLTASGKPFSSEAILSKKHMLKAHEILNAEQLLVSIPRRTGLMVVDKAAPEEIISKFIYLHNHAWNDDSYGNAPIVNMLFVIEKGEITGAIPLD